MRAMTPKTVILWIPRPVVVGQWYTPIYAAIPAELETALAGHMVALL